MRKLSESLLTRAAFAVLVLVLVGSPWMFAAWEMWIFWPFAVLLFIASLLTGVRLTAGTDRTRRTGERARPQDGAAAVLWSTLPFLLYAAIRAIRVEVYMDAERSLLLFVTPLLVGTVVVYGLDGGQARRLHAILAMNLAALGLYGLVNHWITADRLVLWREGYPQYYEEARATGSYFCPNHFAGIMEIGLGTGLGLLLAPRVGRATRLAAAGLGVVSLAGIVLSKSRGGYASALALLPALLVWGVLPWRAGVRWGLRAAATAAAAAVVLLLVMFGDRIMARSEAYFLRDDLRGKPLAEVVRRVAQSLPTTTRGLILRGSLRAWQSAPVWGIGPGMHRAMWPHFAATPDGDRDLGVWPSYPHDGSHANAAHSDWLQALEEYGAVGFVLLLGPVVALLAVLDAAIRREARRWREGTAQGDGLRLARRVGAVLALAALMFHSLGDFNLQMPATVWTLAAAVALGVRR
jgi:O-antigen ligase